MVGLCDYNPFGLALLMTYRFATVGSAFEGSGHETPSLRWLGLRRSHVLKLKSTGNMKSASQSSPSDCRVSESSVTDNTIIPSKSGLCDDMLSIQTNKGLSSKRKYDDKSTVVCLNTRDTFVMAHFQTDTMMQPLSVTDHRKIKSMLTSKMFKALPREYSAELVNMKNGTLTELLVIYKLLLIFSIFIFVSIIYLGGVKCELETLYSMGLDYLSDFLEYALLTKDYI